LSGSAVRVENGQPSIAIDGTCAYWISAGWLNDSLARDRGWRTGQLPSDLRTILDATLGVYDLSSLSDCPNPGGLSDASTRVLSNEQSSAQCRTSGTLFDPAWAILETRASALWAAATPLSAGIRLAAFVASDQPPTSPSPKLWPLTQPLSGFLINDVQVQFSPGVSKLVSTSTDAKTLRTLRDQYLTDREASPDLFIPWDGMLVSDGTTTVNLYMRDDLPYEDAQGLLQFAKVP
jgi:hypothetical protein